MEEQIKEMANDIAKICPDLVENSCGQINCVTHLTLSLYKEGYRKQSEWISVEDRLPERNGGYITHCKIEGQSLVCVLYYCKVGGFNEGTVTHWMPLPEPPKGEDDEKQKMS